MADALRPLTLLLGAVGLWALSLLVLALAGLGSQFAAPAAVAAPPPLPKINLTRSQSRLGPISDYLVVGERPLMTEDRRPSLALATQGESASNDLDVTLTSVLLTPGLQLAILTDKEGGTRRVRVGENVEGTNWRLVSLDPRSAVVVGPSGQRNLELRVFDGTGGQQPTPLTARPTLGQAARDRADRAQPPLLPPPPPAANGNAGGNANATARPVQPTITPQPVPATAPVTQEQQVEAIRRRIEARRAQMRAEAEAAGAIEK